MAIAINDAPTWFPIDPVAVRTIPVSSPSQFCATGRRMRPVIDAMFGQIYPTDCAIDQVQIFHEGPTL
jgi:hypothetical protein